MLCLSQQKLSYERCYRYQILSLFFCVRRRLLLVLHVKPPHFLGRSTRSVGNFLDYFETTGFDGAGHAVETMDPFSKALALLSEDIP